jgi:hypothetical protein
MGGMSDRLQNIVAWTVGPTIWISSALMTIHGLWAGQWYGYVLGSILVVGVGIIFIAKWRSDRESDAEIERLFKP